MSTALAAQRWSLDTLATDVVDESNARTRFVLAGLPGPPPAPTGAVGLLSSLSLSSPPYFFPGAGGAGGPTRTKRVLALASSTTPSASVARPSRSAASAVLTPASARPCTTSWAAAALEFAGTVRASGKVFGQPSLHLCRRDGKGCDGLDVRSLRARRTAMLKATSRVCSAKICSGVPAARLSIVGTTEPSMEFSIGAQA